MSYYNELADIYKLHLVIWNKGTKGIDTFEKYT